MHYPLFVNEIMLRKMPPRNSYLSSLSVVKYLAETGSIPLTSPVTFFVGENGTGKSTLLEAVAVAFGFNAEGGTRNFTFSTNNTHSELHECIRLSRTSHVYDGFFLRAESIYNLATDIDRMDSEISFDPPVINGYGGVSLHEQSHGESFLAIVKNRFRGNGLYILDEPEAALSPMRQMSLLVLIEELVRNNSQFIISTHSPILMSYPQAQIYELNESGIKQVSYKETEHYMVTRQFLDNPEKMLHYLFSDND